MLDLDPHMTPASHQSLRTPFIAQALTQVPRTSLFRAPQLLRDIYTLLEK